MLMAAVAAVRQIKKGCEMLREGRAEIDGFKKSIEQGIGDAKAIFKEVTGLWGWVKSLFGVKPAPKVSQVVQLPQSVQPTKTPKRTQKEPELSYEEFQFKVIVDVSEQLGVFFDIHQKLTTQFHDMELDSQDVYDPHANLATRAVQRVTVGLQLEILTTQIREAMVYAPPELKDIYTRFLEAYNQIVEEQEFARLEQLRKANESRWLREEINNFQIDLAMALVAVAVVIVILWTMLLGVASRRETLRISSSAWSCSPWCASSFYPLR